ncbi:MAG: glycosyltransferase family 2 protein [Pseudomonadota bacterium]
MKVTLITVCYNSARSIADTLHSVDAQSWPDIEHLVIDGASTDDTLAVVSRYPQPWRRVVSEPDAGIYDAMNKGLALATGTVVGFLNADDVLADSEVIARIAEAARQGAGVVYGDLCYVSASRPQQVVRYWTSRPFQAALLRSGWMPPHPTFYVRRTLLQSTGGFDVRYRIAADYDLMVRVLLAAEVSIVYLPHVLVRMQTGGASNRSLRNLLQKSCEDADIAHRHKLGGWWTVLLKNISKIPQFFKK